MFGWIKKLFKSEPEPSVVDYIVPEVTATKPQLLIDSPVVSTDQIVVNTTEDLLKILKNKPSPVVPPAPESIIIKVKKPRAKKTVTKTAKPKKKK